MSRRKLAALSLAVALLAVPVAPAWADVDTYALEARNIDALAAQVARHHWIGPKDKLFVASSVPASGLDAQFFQDMLVSGLLRRGITVLADPRGATKVMTYMWLRPDQTPLKDIPRFSGDAPAQATALDDRILLQITDAKTHAIVASRLIDALGSPEVPIATTASASIASAALRTTALAQTYALLPEPANSIGLGISWLSGSGVTYRHWFPDGFGFQVAAVPFLSISPNASGSSSLTGLGNIGMQGMYKFLRWQNFRLFWLLGFGYAYNTWFTDGNGTPRNDFGLAPGIGADWMLASNLGLNLSLGYTVSYTQIGGQPGQPGFSPGAGGGIFLDW